MFFSHVRETGVVPTDGSVTVITGFAKGSAGKASSVEGMVTVTDNMNVSLEDVESLSSCQT